MKACVVLALFLLMALAVVAYSQEIDEQLSPIHNMLKRQIRPITPQLPRCALWECNSNCIRRGFRGGYCAFTGCQCY